MSCWGFDPRPSFIQKRVGIIFRFQVITHISSLIKKKHNFIILVRIISVTSYTIFAHNHTIRCISHNSCWPPSSCCSFSFSLKYCSRNPSIHRIDIQNIPHTNTGISKAVNEKITAVANCGSTLRLLDISFGPCISMISNCRLVDYVK